jgi:hypothetical protein
MAALEQLAGCMDRIYAVFAGYARPPKPSFCDFCYDREEIEYFQSTPLKQFNPEMARRLIWESSDHWQDTPTYKHYLPLLLEHLAPPIRCEPLYPEHLFETLRAHDFRTWPGPECEALWTYVVAVNKALEEIDPEAARAWRISAGKLAGSPYPNDGLLSSDRLDDNDPT